jgi:hypothetical protein
MSILKIQSNQARKEHKSIKSSKDEKEVDPPSQSPNQTKCRKTLILAQQ